jgi:hypothetical protein
LDRCFFDFKEAYPAHRRKGGDDARRLFARALRAVTMDQLMASLEQHKRSAQWNQDAGRFVPSMITWLRDEHWTQVLPEPKTKASRLTPFEQARRAGLK